MKDNLKAKRNDVVSFILESNDIEGIKSTLVITITINHTKNLGKEAFLEMEILN